MSFSVSKRGKAAEVEGGLEMAGNAAKAGRNGFETKAIDLAVALGVEAVRHASVDADKVASVSASGHYGEDGIGGFTVNVSISQQVEASSGE